MVTDVRTEMLLYVCAGVCGVLECRDGSPGSCASIYELLAVLESFRKPLCLATLKHILRKNGGSRRRSVVDEVRRPGAYSLIKRGRTGKHPTTIPAAISAELEGRSVCINMIVKMCLPYDQIRTRPKSYPAAGFVTDRYRMSWHLLARKALATQASMPNPKMAAIRILLVQGTCRRQIGLMGRRRIVTSDTRLNHPEAAQILLCLTKQVTALDGLITAQLLCPNFLM